MKYHSPYVRPATESDAVYLAPRLREIDKAELMAVGCSSPEFALRFSFTFSAECHTITHPETSSPIGMFGVGPSMQEELGYRVIWLLSSPELTGRYSLPFLRLCKVYIDDFLVRYGDSLGNVVMADNTTHIKWLEWCGFSLSSTFRSQENGVLFNEYILRL